MIDIIYPLGSGSKWNNNELRYSLRSIEKHIKNFRNVYIIGECPDWIIKRSETEGAFINGVTHIPFEESGHASKNIMEKILAACDQQDISEEFLFMNDDIFLMEDIDAASFPFYYDRNVVNHLSVYANYYNEYIKATHSELIGSGLNTKYFDIHVPIRYNKKLFPEVMDQFDFNKKLIVKSVYCNALNIQGEQRSDCKIMGKRPAKQILAEVENTTIFSTGDQCLLDWSREESTVKTILKNTFPNKSKFEI
jgi:hypothetical protein